VDTKQAFEDHKKELYTEFRGKSKLFQEAQDSRNQARELESTLKMLIEDATATGTADVDKKVVDATIALKEAAAKARAGYQPQLAWIDSFTYQINGGYYNYNHGKYCITP